MRFIYYISTFMAFILLASCTNSTKSSTASTQKPPAIYKAQTHNNPLKSGYSGAITCPVKKQADGYRMTAQCKEVAKKSCEKIKFRIHSQATNFKVKSVRKYNDGQYYGDIAYRCGRVGL